MEKMPFRESGAVIRETTIAELAWRTQPLVLTGDAVTLRELRASDAATLLAMLSKDDEVARFLSPLPTTLDAFEQFIAALNCEREAGREFCFGVVPTGMDNAVGIFKVHQLEPGFATAQWTFALGSAYWGTGLFVESARLVIDFSFRIVGVHRLEARVALKNGRGNGALRKLGASQEGVLRGSLIRSGEYLDQVLWALVDHEPSSISDFCKYSGPVFSVLYRT